jgi:hypothetical protein
LPLQQSGTAAGGRDTFVHSFVDRIPLSSGDDLRRLSPRTSAVRIRTGRAALVALTLEYAA